MAPKSISCRLRDSIKLTTAPKLNNNRGLPDSRAGTAEAPAQTAGAAQSAGSGPHGAGSRRGADGRAAAAAARWGLFIFLRPVDFQTFSHDLRNLRPAADNSTLASDNNYMLHHVRCSALREQFDLTLTLTLSRTTTQTPTKREQQKISAI